MLIVILVFLQSWRALLVPATTVPVTIIGAFAFMPFLGFSINLLTLFGLILAIGIVVDDAIVIVENASHHIEQGMPPREATIQAMNEVTGPVISITLVLMAVFLPTAFLGGITGQMYRQFALTIAATALISAINALTLKPAQCATWLRPAQKTGWFARAFDVGLPAGRARLRAGRSGNCCRCGGWCCSCSSASRSFTGVVVSADADRVPAGGGPGVRPHRRATARTPRRSTGPGRWTEQLNDDPSATRRACENWFVLGGFSLLDGTAAPNAATRSSPGRTGSERTTAGTAAGRAGRATPGASSAQIREAQFRRHRPAVDPGAGVRRRVPDADRGPRGRRAGRAPGAGAGDHDRRRRPAAARDSTPRRFAGDASGPACRRST